jgi:benzylsuccinate CoA-transferase BbsF subunit
MLAEMGADVIKIESPKRPDPLRTGPISPHLPRVFEPSGVETNLMFASYSRSCRSVALDMTDQYDRAVFTELVAAADVLIDNFASGVMASWGLAHETLAGINPRLIMITVSGYGRTGPRSHYLAYGANINSFMGLSQVWAPHGTHFEYTAVAHVLVAVLAALAQRDRSGLGTLVDIAQIEAGAALLAPLYLSALNDGDPAVPAPNTVPGSALAAVLRCAGDDQWVAVELEDDADVTAAAQLVGRADLSRSGPVEATGRLQALRSALAQWAMECTAEQAAARLQGAGLAAAAVRGTADEFRSAQLWGRAGVTPVRHPDLGPVLYPSPFHRLSTTPVRIQRPSARLGQHTDEVLTQWLGRRKAG